jgi:hypothetical protein
VVGIDDNEATNASAGEDLDRRRARASCTDDSDGGST